MEAFKGTNTLSDEILTIISRAKGQFFTLLPDNANIDGLYQFSGSILPPEPKKRGKVGNLSGIYTYSEIASMNEEIAVFLYEQIQKHGYQFIADDYNATYQEVKNKEWFNLYGLHYLEDIYYFLPSQDATPLLIKQCLSRSNTFWHSLSILSKQSMLDHTKKSLQLSDIQDFCSSAQFVLVGAYDGEGQIIWERDRS